MFFERVRPWTSVIQYVRNVRTGLKIGEVDILLSKFTFTIRTLFGMALY